MVETGEGQLTTTPGQPSLVDLANILLRRRKLILRLATVGCILGLILSFALHRTYISRAVFVPQGSEAGPFSIALAASQLGINAPTTSSWGSSMYVELLGSRALLESVARDTFALDDTGTKRRTISQLLEIDEPNPSLRADRSLRALRQMISVSEDKKIGAVRIAVATRWPDVSRGIAQRLILAVNKFNVETRKSQAMSERQFAESQAAAAERALRESEDRLQEFLQRNRTISLSSELAFVRDRLQRDVTLRQQLYTSLAQNRENARIREVRETPVITVIDTPSQPMNGEPRGVAVKAMVGALVGGAVAIFVALLGNAMERVQSRSDRTTREFLALLGEMTPRFLRRRNRVRGDAVVDQLSSS